MIRRVALILALLTTPAAAQTPEEIQAAATNMWVALRICLEQSNTPENVAVAFRDAGLHVSPIQTGGLHEFGAFGVTGALRPAGTTEFASYCLVESTLVPTELAEDVLHQAATATFPQAEIAPPQRIYGTGCNIMSVTLNGIRHELHFGGVADPDNCGDGTTTAVSF